MSEEIKLPKEAMMKPFIKGAEVVATERGWEAVYPSPKISNEILVESKGLLSKIMAAGATHLIGLRDTVEDKVEGIIDTVKDDAKSIVSSVVIEVLDVVEDKVDTLKEIIDQAQEKLESPKPLTRQDLMKMEFNELRKLGGENEVTGNSRVKLVDGICAAIGI